MAKRTLVPKSANHLDMKIHAINLNCEAILARTFMVYFGKHLELQEVSVNLSLNNSHTHVRHNSQILLQHNSWNEKEVEQWSNSQEKFKTLT